MDANGNANGITIELALAELIADSDSELAFAMGHELGHVYQMRSGSASVRRLVWNQDAELDADTWGLYFLLLSGYDPYAGAGTLAKLYMATGEAGLSGTLFEGAPSADMHGSLRLRLDAVQLTIQQLCSRPDIASTCTQMRQLFHPNFPGSPL